MSSQMSSFDEITSSQSGIKSYTVSFILDSLEHSSRDKLMTTLKALSVDLRAIPTSFCGDLESFRSHEKDLSSEISKALSFWSKHKKGGTSLYHATDVCYKTHSGKTNSYVLCPICDPGTFFSTKESKYPHHLSGVHGVGLSGKYAQPFIGLVMRKKQSDLYIEFKPTVVCPYNTRGTETPCLAEFNPRNLKGDEITKGYFRHVNENHEHDRIPKNLKRYKAVVGQQLNVFIPYSKELHRESQRFLCNCCGETLLNRDPLQTCSDQHILKAVEELVSECSEEDFRLLKILSIKYPYQVKFEETHKKKHASDVIKKIRKKPSREVSFDETISVMINPTATSSEESVLPERILKSQAGYIKDHKYVDNNSAHITSNSLPTGSFLQQGSEVFIKRHRSNTETSIDSNMNLEQICAPTMASFFRRDGVSQPGVSNIHNQDRYSMDSQLAVQQNFTWEAHNQTNNVTLPQGQIFSQTPPANQIITNSVFDQMQRTQSLSNAEYFAPDNFNVRHIQEVQPQSGYQVLQYGQLPIQLQPIQQQSSYIPQEQYTQPQENYQLEQNNLQQVFSLSSTYQGLRNQQYSTNLPQYNPNNTLFQTDTDCVFQPSYR